MKLVTRVTSGLAFNLGAGPLNTVWIAALGEVPTSGWTGGSLTPYVYIHPPVDGIWDFSMVADPPFGPAADVVVPISATGTYRAPNWLKGVRLHGEVGALEVMLGKAPALRELAEPALTASSRTAIEITLGRWEDSHQPTGTIHWKNDGPFNTPVPHPEWKKLVHQAVLRIEGPDEAAIRRCIDQALTAAVLAAVAAAIATGGLGAGNAALSAGMSALTACLGDSYSVQVHDKSHWEYWDM